MQRILLAGKKYVLYVLILILFSTVLNAQAPPAYQDLPNPDSVDQSISGGQVELGEYNEAYYLLPRINEGLPPPADTFYQISPYEVMESFVRACRAGHFEQAAHALNLSLIPAEQHKTLGPQLAQQFYYVLDQRLRIQWSSLSDRPDGAYTSIGPNVKSGNLFTAQRSVPIGGLSADGREIRVRLQRIKTDGNSPKWYVAMTTVEEIPTLYKVYGPAWLELNVPEWSRQRFFGVPIWGLIGIVLGLFVAWAIGRVTYKLFKKACYITKWWWANQLGDELGKPLGVAAGVLFYFWLLRNVLSITGPWAQGFFTFMLTIVMLVLIWVASRGIDYVFNLYSDTQLADIEDEENDESRRMMTMLSVGRRVLVFALIVFGISVVFSRISGLEGVGYALLGSAGFMAIVLGIAAQSTLGNLVAGVQIAVTRPVRIGDVVLYEGYWGSVEDVRFTFLVIKTWDMRRLVVPLKYFIDKPFENWSMTDSKLLKGVYLYVDYRTDVRKIRDHFDEFVRNHELWNKYKDPYTQVTKITNETLEVRCVLSAEDSSSGWDFVCQAREEMIRFVQKLEGGERLPQTRVVIGKELAEGPTDSTLSEPSDGISEDAPDEEND